MAAGVQRAGFIKNAEGGKSAFFAFAGRLQHGSCPKLGGRECHELKTRERRAALRAGVWIDFERRLADTLGVTLRD